ncbi:MAG: protein-L-isoaspartate(D-aspartate) O-methyltransferase [Bacteroidota bacterium]
MNLVDTYRQKGLRKKLIQSLREKGKFNDQVLQAMERIPRHLFLPNSSAFDTLMYEDRAFRIAGGQTISHPSTVACQTTLLEIQLNDKILEIGTGSGYQAAVLSEMGARVYSIERQKVLFDTTPGLLKQLGYTKIKTFFGDGFAGVAAFAPYDKILITCASPEIPESLIKQLKIGGYFVLPLTNEDDNQTMIRIIKKSETELLKEEFGTFSFVPMLKGKSY